MAGTLSTAAMPGLNDWRPEKTAPVVAKLMEAGAIPIAKTTLPEAAVRASGLNARAQRPVPVAEIYLHVGSSPSEGSSSPYLIPSQIESQCGSLACGAGPRCTA